MIERVCSLIKMMIPERNRGLLWASKSRAPVNATDNDGYQTGCLWINTAGSTGTSMYVNEGSVTVASWKAVDTSAGAAAGTVQFDDATTGPLISIETTDQEGDAYLNPFLITGTYGACKKGIMLSATNPRPVTFLFDNHSVALGAADYRAVLSRVYICSDQANAITLNAMRAQIKLADLVDISSASSVTAPFTGYLELAGAGAKTLNGHVACVRAALETGAGAHALGRGLAGFESTLNSSGSFTASKLFGYTVNISSGTTKWQFGYKVEDSSCDTGIGVGICVTGISMLGVTGRAIDIQTSGVFRMGIQGAGVDLVTAYPYAVEVHCEANADIAAASSSAGIYTRFAIEAAQTTLLNHIAVFGKLRVLANMASGNHCSVYALVESSAGVIAGGQTAAGIFALDFSSTNVTSGNLNGIIIDSSVDTGGTMTATMSALRIKKSGSHMSWTTGIAIEPTAVTAGITLGAEKFLTTESGYGLVLDGVTTNYGCSFHFDDGGVELESGWSEGVRSGYLVTQDITDNDVSIHSFHGYVYVAAASCSSKGGFAGVEGSILVKAGSTIANSVGLCDFTGGHFSCNVPATAIIGANTWACGVSVGGNLGGTHTGNAAGYRVRLPSAGKWDAGLRIEPLACVEAIQIGEAKFATGSHGYGIPLDGVTQHSGIEIYFDDGGVKLAAGYTEAIMTGFLVSKAITDADVSLYTRHDYVYISQSVTTSGGVGATWASLLVKAGMTITTSSGLCDFSAFNASVDIPSTAVIATGTFACGISFGGNMGGTHTGNAVGFRLRDGYNGSWDGLCDISDQVVTASVDAAGDGEGSITIFIAGVKKYLQYWPSATA